MILQTLLKKELTILVKQSDELAEVNRLKNEEKKERAKKAREERKAKEQAGKDESCQLAVQARPPPK